MRRANDARATLELAADRNRLACCSVLGDQYLVTAGREGVVRIWDMKAPPPRDSGARAASERPSPDAANNMNPVLGMEAAGVTGGTPIDAIMARAATATEAMEAPPAIPWVCRQSLSCSTGGVLSLCDLSSTLALSGVYVPPPSLSRNPMVAGAGLMPAIIVGEARTGTVKIWEPSWSSGFDAIQHRRAWPEGAFRRTGELRVDQAALMNPPPGPPGGGVSTTAGGAGSSGGGTAGGGSGSGGGGGGGVGGGGGGGGFGGAAEQQLQPWHTRYPSWIDSNDAAVAPNVASVVALGIEYDEETGKVQPKRIAACVRGSVCIWGYSGGATY